MNVKSNISFFLSDFEDISENIAIIWNDKKISYGQILKRISYWRKELRNIKPSTIVGLEGDFSPETISILFVLIEKNVIVVPLDINHSPKNGKKIKISQLQVHIKIKNEKDVKISKIQTTDSLNDLYNVIKERQAPGLVLFTSGSSGEPKAALHDFSKLLIKFKVRRKSLRTINFLLFDHWGGLNTLFHILSNGGTVVILENRKPDYICALIEKHKVELLPTSPTFLNLLVMSRAFERYDISSLKLITYGAEPMPESLLERLNKIFPNISLQQTYGLIELGVMRSKSEEKGSLWVKIGGDGFKTRVVNNLLEIKSESAMIGYLNAKSPFTEDGWFMTGDSVEQKGEYFRILGRKSELINVGGEKVYPQEVESVILNLDKVIDVLVYGEKNPFTGNIVCAKVYLDSDIDKKSYLKQIKIHCKKILEPFKVPVKIIIMEESFFSERFKKKRV